MAARPTAEQRELRTAAARLAAELGPGSVQDLAGGDRVERLEKAVAATGWRRLRSGGASGVEVAIVAEEFGRGLVDVPFAGPVLADDLRAGGGAGPQRCTIGVDGEAFDARGIGAVLTLEGTRVLSGCAGAPVPGADLTRQAVEVAGPLAPAGGLPAGRAERWRALAQVITCADLAGAARGAYALACDYAKVAEQDGRTAGSRQAAARLLAEGPALIDGAVSALRHAAWAVDALPPPEAVHAARIAKLYCVRAARTVCETAVQVHGGPGNAWECLTHVHLRRTLAATGLFPVFPGLRRTVTGIPSPHGRYGGGNLSVPPSRMNSPFSPLAKVNLFAGE